MGKLKREPRLFISAEGFAGTQISRDVTMLEIDL